MSPWILFATYAGIGFAAALAVAARGKRSLSTAASALAVVALWPLWAPFALARPVRAHAEPRRAAERRVHRALRSARDAVRDTALDKLLTERDAEAILREVTRIARRLDLVEVELDSAAAGRAQSSPGRARRVSRLEELALGDRRALEELAELAELLSTELTLARFGHGDGALPLIEELAARVEALRAS